MTTPDVYEDDASYWPNSGIEVIEYVEKYRKHERIEQLKYDCGHCGTTVMGWMVATAEPVCDRRWLLCPECGRGSVQNGNVMLPSRPSFPAIDGLSGGIRTLHDEARASFDARAYTGCEMLCRKILMAAAVDKGAGKNEKFVQYVDYLSSEGYITPPLKEMATIIRGIGNRATHEIDAPDLGRSRHTLVFTRRILDSMYGAEHDLDKYGGGQTSTKGVADRSFALTGSPP